MPQRSAAPLVPADAALRANRKIRWLLVPILSILTLISFLEFHSMITLPEWFPLAFTILLLSLLLYLWFKDESPFRSAYPLFSASLLISSIIVYVSYMQSEIQSLLLLQYFPNLAVAIMLTLSIPPYTFPSDLAGSERKKRACLEFIFLFIVIFLLFANFIDFFILMKFSLTAFIIFLLYLIPILLCIPHLYLLLKFLKSEKPGIKAGR